MSEQDVAILDDHPEWGVLLAAYQTLQTISPDGWVDRLLEIPGLPADQLPKLHGKLIALGYLEFELADRTGGMRYQLSGTARRLLAGAPAYSEDAEPEDSDQDGAEAA